MSRIPTEASGNRAKSAEWNAMKGVVEVSGWLPTSGFALNTTYSNGDTKALLLADVMFSGGAVPSLSSATVLSDSGNPPTTIIAEIGESGLAGIGKTLLEHITVPIDPNAFFMISGSSGATLTRASLRNW